MNTLIIGSTSGLGLELAREFTTAGDEVIITGRKDPSLDSVDFRPFDLIGNLADRTKTFVDELPEIHRLIYAAGYYQEGRITDLTNEQIEEMIDVGGRGLIYFTKWLLEKQEQLVELITITSTSQWTPRKLEPIYNFAKAGAGHFTNSMAKDGRVEKVMVAGPADMDTNFWKGTDMDVSEMLDPAWAAGQIMEAREEDYKYKYIRILRQPPRVEEIEKR